MELRDHALAVLFGATLADKLAPIGSPTDETPGRPIEPPLAPNRPPELRIRRRAAGRPPDGAPPTGVGDERDRARVLRALVNHELQALELLALALARFPDADPRLRLQWAATLGDEQRHLALYLARLGDDGIGDQGVGAFFWDALRGASDPVGFTVGLGLVLEQANLDFSRRWRAAFALAQDHETAAVLDQVYEDEIRHVRIAARVLRADQRPDESLFDAFTRNLRPPLSVARARAAGPTELDRDGRRRAGLDEAFVDAVAVFGGSKGPDPRVFALDPHVEDDLAGRVVNHRLDGDLAGLPIVAARAGDVVVAPVPSAAFLAGLAAAGFPLPQVVAEPDPARWVNGRAASVWTWGTSPRIAERLAKLGVVHDPRSEVLYDKAWVAERAPAWLEAAELPCAPGDVGIVCATHDEVGAAAARVGQGIAKAAIATAGRHRAWFRGGVLDPRGAAVVADALGRGRVVVEPRHDVLVELSALGQVGDDGEVSVIGVTRFGCTGGTYRGSVIGRPDLGCDSVIARFVHGDGGRGLDVGAGLARLVRVVGAAAADQGLRGPFGIDARIVRRDDGALGLVALGELNPRPTMGHLAHALRSRLAGGSAGLWLFLPVAAIGDPVAFARAAADVAPVIVAGGRLRAGAVPTSDPARAERLWTLLVAGRTFGAAVEAWASIADRGARPDVLRSAAGWATVGGRPGHG